MPKSVNYYYDQLNKEQQKAYYAMKQGLLNLQDSTAVELVPQYLFPKDKIKEHRQAMESRVKKLARQAANLDEKGKELFIHDFIVENVKYDKLKKAYSHEIIGALGNGVAVCEGIAKAVKKGKVLLFHWRGGYLTKEIQFHGKDCVLHVGGIYRGKRNTKLHCELRKKQPVQAAA